MRNDSPGFVPSTRRSVADVAVVRLALLLATGAMAALHVLQPTLHPIHRPVSFYIHGEYGWLLPLSLGAFGFAAFACSLLPPIARSRGPARSLALFGIGMLVTALVPSDRWFPWENAPSVSGLIHATVAITAPLLLLDPMLAPLRGDQTPLTRGGLPRRPLIVVVYTAAVLGSGASLAFGLLLDRPPPWIGLAERVLALAAVAWLAFATRPGPR